jgi:hypothetical protein
MGPDGPTKVRLAAVSEVEQVQTSSADALEQPVAVAAEPEAHEPPPVDEELAAWT